MRRGSAVAVVNGLLFLAACATMTPEARVRDEIFWDAAKECESRYRTLHVDRIDSDGSVTAHTDAESRMDLASFSTCYRQGVETRVERRRQAGLPVPEGLNQELTVEID
jgi:hypothetical protein